MGFGQIDGKPTEMHEHLKILCGDDKREDGERKRMSVCEAYGEPLKKELLNHLNAALDKALKETVADNVTLVESFYDYIDPDRTASVEVVGFPETLKYVEATNDFNYTNTVVFHLPELSQDNITEIVFEAKFSLKGLPIFISEDSEPIIFGTPTGVMPKSAFRYRWLKNDTFNYNIELRGHSIDIESAPPEVKTKNKEPQTVNNRPNENPLGIGFGLMTSAIFGLTFMIFRQKFWRGKP